MTTLTRNAFRRVKDCGGKFCGYRGKWGVADRTSRTFSGVGDVERFGDTFRAGGDESGERLRVRIVLRPNQVLIALCIRASVATGRSTALRSEKLVCAVTCERRNCRQKHGNQ